MKFECPICKLPLKQAKSPKIIQYKARSFNLGSIYCITTVTGNAVTVGTNTINLNTLNLNTLNNIIINSNTISIVNSKSLTCRSHMEIFPGTKKLVDNNHCRLNYINNKIVSLIICVFPYQFMLDYENNITEIFSLKYNKLQNIMETENIVKINSILDLPWSHKAQVLDKTKMYILFS